MKFNNKLYSGKRRFMAQYVENFPIPNPSTPKAKEVIKLMKKMIGDGYVNMGNQEKINNIIENLFS